MDKAQIRASIAWREENGIPQIPGDVEALQAIEERETMASQETHPIDENEDPETPEEVEEADPEEDPADEDADEDEDPGDEDED